MKKVIIVLGVVIVIIGIASFYLFSNLNSIVKTAIEKYGSTVTQTAVQVDKVQIKLSEGAGTIKGLTIANPTGFDADFAFSLGEITTGIDLKSLQQEPYVINEVTVREPIVSVEINSDRKTNLNELKKTIMKAVPQNTPSTANSDSAKEITGNEPRLIIRKLIFSQGTIKVLAKPLNNKQYTLKLTKIDIKNLGGKTGATPAELSKEILNRLIEQAKKDIKEKGINVEIGKLKAKAKVKIDEQEKKLKSESDAKLNKEKQKIKDKLRYFLIKK